MKFLISLLTVILITSAAIAQHTGSPKGHVNLGFKGGVNLYKINNDNNTKFDKVTGYHFGLLGHIHFNNQWAIQPELVYSNQGAMYSDNKYNLDYINVPIILQYMFNNGFRLQAGPQLGFLVRAENKDELNPIDLSVGFGMSYVVPATGLGFDVRYNHGFSNINKNNAIESTNSGFQLGLFYILGHNTK
jgi:hypothetical protein